MGVNRAMAVLVKAVLGTSALYAQEDLVSPVALREADAVVLGTLKHEFRFPSLDGWNERGLIAEQVLKGNVKASSVLPLAWERDFIQGCCLTRPDWRGAIGERGIWTLRRDGARYRAPDLFLGFQA